MPTAHPAAAVSTRANARARSSPRNVMAAADSVMRSPTTMLPWPWVVPRPRQEWPALEQQQRLRPRRTRRARRLGRSRDRLSLGERRLAVSLRNGERAHWMCEKEHTGCAKMQRGVRAGLCKTKSLRVLALGRASYAP